MKNDFLDDDWLKEELTDEYIHDDDFSFTVVKKIAIDERKSKRNFYLLLVALLTIISCLFIPDLMTISAQDSMMFAASEQSVMSFMQMEFIGLCVICLSFILIWSFEDFDLI
jgi:hypothetical protein